MRIRHLFNLLAFALICVPASPGSETQPPNIVFILIDDLGWADPGCYGHRFHETPHINKLAEQGLRFTDAYAAAPVCSPTRASIISGQYPAHVGITDFIPGHWRPYAPLRVPVNRTQRLPLEVVTFAERLKQAGYATGYFGKWHLGGKGHQPADQGFDTSEPRSGHWVRKEGKRQYLAEYLTDKTVDFMRTHRQGPFLVYLSHYAVHIPLEAEEDLIAKYRDKPKPREGVNHPVYAAMVEHVDRSVGRIMEALDELKLAENTVVVFFSDNGGLRQRFDGKGDIVSTNAPLRDEKGTLYEGGIREPLIVRWPGTVRPGRVDATPVTSVDFYPTLLEIAGLKAESGWGLDGISLVPLLKETGSPDREAIYWHYPHYHHSTPAGAIRRGRWKLLEFFKEGRLELYDLESDIGESNNLAEQKEGLARDLQARLAAWRESVGAEMPKPNPDQDPARAAEWGAHPDRAKPRAGKKR